jgi:hypothetical protein
MTSFQKVLKFGLLGKNYPREGSHSLPYHYNTPVPLKLHNQSEPADRSTLLSASYKLIRKPAA